MGELEGPRSLVTDPEGVSVGPRSLAQVLEEGPEGLHSLMRDLEVPHSLVQELEELRN